MTGKQISGSMSLVSREYLVLKDEQKFNKK